MPFLETGTDNSIASQRGEKKCHVIISIFLASKYCHAGQTTFPSQHQDLVCGGGPPNLEPPWTATAKASQIHSD